MSVLTLIIIIVSFAIIVVVSDFFILRKFRNAYMQILAVLTGGRNRDHQEETYSEDIKFDQFTDHLNDVDEDEDDDNEEQTAKEELSVEINREVEKITEEMRHHEQLREKLEKHYVTLRKVARDMLESLISPPPYISPSDTHIPVPIMDERPLWMDLSRNHIPVGKGDIFAKWSEYVEEMNRITVTKTRVFRSVEAYLFGGYSYPRIEASQEDGRDNFYTVDGMLLLLNSIYFNGQAKLEITDGRRQKRISKNPVLMLDGTPFAKGKSDEISSIEAKVNNLMNTDENWNVEGMDELMELLRKVETIKNEISATLNWFIFDNSEMKMCEMVKND